MPLTLTLCGLRHLAGQFPTDLEMLWFPVWGPVCSLPVAVNGPSRVLGWSDFLFQAGWGRSIWLSDVPGSTWPAGQRHCQPFLQVYTAQVHKQAVHCQHGRTPWLQLISQCIELSGSSPGDSVTGVPLSPVSSFTVAFLWKSLSNGCGRDRDMDYRSHPYLLHQPKPSTHI